LAESHHVVVDGSNLATEGRTLPSLKQLDEAVRAYAAEDPGSSIIVVVDATFEHRVSDAEREEVRQAMLNGEVISPPAGAIGRGDAFVLRIAERTGAVVLSNDSFQEFHGEHPWLFDEGRLIGGKPVPGVGWIFTPRLPIRGPKSRAATAEARSKKDPESAPAKAAELAKAAKKAAKKGSKAQKTAKKRAPAIEVDTSWPITPTAPPPGRAKLDPVFSSAVDEAVEEALHPPAPQKSRGNAKKQTAPKKEAPPKSATARNDTASGRGGGRRRSQVKAEATRDGGEGQVERKRSAPLPAVNEPLAFINFVAAFSVGSTIEGEVVSFTSHGAMVDVPLPGGGALHCYIPLTAMGTPPPNKARQVLKKGEVRPFVLAGLDPPRRVAELALPSPATEAKKQHSPAKKAPPAATSAPTTKASPSKKKAAAKKAAAPAKKAAKKAAATAKKATKKAAAKKAAKAKQAPAKKATAKKAGTARPR
jgi:Zc3h12a-like Ribonuclease NYN domain